ncbi:stress-induced-phosphoprotein 1-like [Porites lutea]|uniref:stress-induced-phosphoprotein 1-like n=1 Tax=Porites lutea TaxID=51062 RepID=UPI003CC6C80F
MEDNDFEEDTLREKAEVHKNAGNEAYSKKDFAKAISFYTEGIRIQCTDKQLVSKLYNNRSTIYFYLENYHDCLNDVKAAIALQPFYLKAIIRGARACLKLKQFEEAMIWCDKGLAIGKDNQELLKIKSCSIKEHEKLSKQEGDGEAKEEDDSGNNPKSLDCTLTAETHKNAGNNAFRKDDFVTAINLYTEGIEVKCNDEDLNAKLYNNRASAHYHLGNYQDCLSDVKAATALQPSYLKAIIRVNKQFESMKSIKRSDLRAAIA